MYGHVLIVGGSLGKSGAAAMAGMAALRAGAGLVTVATAKSALPNVAGFAAELMTEPLAETDTGGIGIAAVKSGKLQQLASTMTVVAIGPGIGRHPETVEFVHEAVRTLKCPLVIDADGLNAFDGQDRVARRQQARAGADAASRRDGAAGGHLDQGGAGRPAQRGAQLRARASTACWC